MQGRPSLRERRRRERRRPHPLSAGGPTWDAAKRTAAPRLRWGAVFSLILHIVVIQAFSMRLPWKRQDLGPVRFPNDLYMIQLSTPSNRPLTMNPPAAQAKKEEKKPEEEKPKIEPERKQEPKPIAPTPKPEQESAKPVPVPDRTVKKPSGATVHEAAAFPASADTAGMHTTTLAMSGGGEGLVGIGFEGPLEGYSYYLLAVRDKIARYWDPPPGIVSRDREVVATVKFRVDRRGNVSGSFIAEPSGNGVFDQAGIRAIERASPLPPLPQDYREDWLGIRVRFVCND